MREPHTADRHFTAVLHRIDAAEHGAPPVAGGALPEWLTRVSDVLLEGDPAAPPPWARRVHQALRHLDGAVPFTAVHCWHTTAAAPLLAEAAVRHGADPAPHRRIGALHRRAASGERVAADAWHAALEPALREVHRLGYVHSAAYARAVSAAESSALSRGWEPDEARRYGEAYARMHADAGARSYAEAEAAADAPALAAAFPAQDPAGYAAARPGALVRAWLAAAADGDGPGGTTGRAARDRLAHGLADALAEASARRGAGSAATRR